MHIKGYVSDAEVSNANMVKDAVVSAMIADGYLTLEKGKEFSSNYAIILRKKSLFGRLIDKLSPWIADKGDEDLFYQMVRFVKSSTNADQFDDETDKSTS